MRRLALIVTIALGLIIGGHTEAAEIKALVSTAMKAPFEDIAAQFGKATGHKVIATFGPTGPLTKRIADGEMADVVILGGDSTAALLGQGKIAAGSNAAAARGLIGAGVAKGAPKPDISSEAAFKAALLSEKQLRSPIPQAAAAAASTFPSCSKRWASPKC